MRNRCRTVVPGIVAALATASCAIADSVNIVGSSSGSTEGLGLFSGVVSYSFGGDGNGILSVTLTNMSPSANGGYITAFAFNLASSDANAVATLQPGADYPFGFFAGQAPPFGSFDAGAGLQGKFTGGGSPLGGIPTGQTGAFIFTIIASDAASLTAGDFLSGPNAYNFVVRFKGFANGGSDKVPGVIVTCPCDLDGDGAVNSSDVQFLLDAWGQGPESGADLDGDGVVGQVDLAMLLECWRDCATAGGGT